MPIKSDEYDGVCVIGVEGDLSGPAAAALHGLAEETAVAGRSNRFVVDLEKTPFVDSEGLEALLLLKKRSESEHGSVKLAGVGAHCRKVLEITRLAPRFECHPDLPSALKAMR
jgi:anti-anti-sigma factor